MGSPRPGPPFPNPWPSMNPIFAIILDPKPLVCTSNAPKLSEVTRLTCSSPFSLAPARFTGLISVVSDGITPLDTKDTG
ncbi:hypothetical protein EUGRSUZ_C04066 [Eucalyptus grandis]|uniref:Uncharacterized protein n=2 Tax=Eucalyptus grandis TaxID=71139 RepID=A0ACC3LKM8_EUCGR|nr:hypothetical protein EUGRSUZ_C04066 [Eucalyptus grandis]